MLEVSGLNQFYGQSHTLWDVALDVQPGSCMCVMGRNGVGKSTLMKTVMGLLKPKSGSIKFAGQELAGKPVEARAKAGIAYVPQGREIFAQRSVEENLKVGVSARGEREIPEAVFRWFPVLKEMLHRRGGDLSGGQQQQLALGRALAIQPKLLILDEPTEGIQPSIILLIGKVLESLKKEGRVAVLLVEQYLEFALKLADRYYVMEKGAVVLSGTAADMEPERIKPYLAF